MAGIDGTEGPDTLWGTDEDDVIRGAGGDDQIDGLGGNDQIFGDAGNDTLDGSLGNDVLDGGSGNDLLCDRTGTNQLNGGEGLDLACPRRDLVGAFVGQTVTFDLTANDQHLGDEAGRPALTYRLVGTPLSGTASINPATGVLTYEAGPRYQESIAYDVVRSADGVEVSARAEIQLVVGTSDDVPTTSPVFNEPVVTGLGVVDLEWTFDYDPDFVQGTRLQYATDPAGPWTNASGPFSATAMSAWTTLTGLTPRTTYYLRANVYNAVGEGPFSTPISVFMPAAPSAPRNLRFTVTPEPLGSSVMQARWDAPVDNGGSPILGYELELATSPSGPWESSSYYQTSSFLIVVDNGTTYYARVAARNQAATGTYSSVVSVKPVAVPREPTNVRAAAGVRSATISWGVPSTNNGAPITGYVILGGTSLMAPLQVIGRVSSTTRTFTKSGLTAGVRYYLSVAAINSAGDGLQAGPYGVTPYGTPSVPLQPRGVPGPGPGRATVSWAPPQSNGGVAITGYAVSRFNPSTRRWAVIARVASTTRSYTISGLTNGSAYYFRVAATNAAGAGTPTASIKVVPIPLPSAPTSLKATPGPGRVSLTWGAPTAPGGALTGYVVYRFNPSTRLWLVTGLTAASTRSFTATGLANGTAYYFRVAAKNAAGTGAQTSSVVATPRTTPSAPRSVALLPGSNRVSVYWQPPSSTGGAAITSYLVQGSTSPTSGWTNVGTTTGSARSYTVTGLTNGRRYYLRVIARNIAGWSPASTPVSAVPTYRGVYFANCTDVHLAGWSFLRSGQTGYRTGLDRDRDGFGCE